MPPRGRGRAVINFVFFALELDHHCLFYFHSLTIDAFYAQVYMSASSSSNPNANAIANSNAPISNHPRGGEDPINVFSWKLPPSEFRAIKIEFVSLDGWAAAGHTSMRSGGEWLSNCHPVRK